jgi:hypothetical protein
LGTDRDLAAEGPCPCGKGKITVTRCSPDHPWGGQSWHEYKIDCRTCARTHTFAKSEDLLDTRSRLVLRKNVEERDGHWKEYLAKSKAIMAMPATRKALAKAKTLLDMQRSVAAKFRFLHHYGLAAMSESTFRKRFGSSDSFLKGLSASDLPAVLKMTNTESAEIDDALADANKSYARYRIPIANVKTGLEGLVA